MVKFKSLLTMFNAYRHSLLNKLQRYFELSSTGSSYTMLSSNKFKIQYTRTSLKAKCVSVKGPKLWNEVPKSVTCIQTPTKFKKVLKYELINVYLHKD